MPSKSLFSTHSENLRAVSAGLKQVQLLHKDAIRRGNEPRERYVARMRQFMVAVMAEAHLAKVIEDLTGFNTRERKLLYDCRSQFDRWLTAVELSFRRYHRIPIHLTLEDEMALAAYDHMTS